MGNFKIEIEAVGGHGSSRETKQGEMIPYQSVVKTEPDRMAFDFVCALAESGCNVLSAKLTHWPESTPIVDDLKTATREVSDFTQAAPTDPLLRFFPMVYGEGGKVEPLSRTFCHLAHEIVVKYPPSAERTLTLRRLIDLADQAKRL